MINKDDKKRLKGIIPAIITPLTQEGKVDVQLLTKQADYLASSSIQGFFVNGTSGEGAWLTTEEKIKVYQVVKEIKKKDQFLCAACIEPSTDMVLREMDKFLPLEPDFIVSVTPYYYNVSQNEILEHFKEIARKSTVPVIVYHIPQNTHNDMTIETILALMKMDNIAGIKDSSGNFSKFSRACLTNVSEQFSWIQGEDYLDAASLNIGADGIVTGLGNVFIKPYVEMYQAVQVNDVKKVFQMQRKINELYEIIQVTGIKVIPSIKAACSLLGRSGKWMKMKPQALDIQQINKVKEVLKNMNLTNSLE